MNIFLIIQARMTSSRLPKKVMLPLCGKTVLQIQLERLESFKENIIIATTDEGSQLPIVELCKTLHVKHYEGDTDDVLSRYYDAALKYGAKGDDIIIRCTSDCPLIDEKIVKETVEFYKSSKAPYVCACQQSGFPRGMDTEVFSFRLLKEANENAGTFHEREHVTPYIKANYKSESFKNSRDHSKYRLTLDEEDDYRAIKEIYEKLECRVDFSYEELIDVLENNSYIYDINAHVEQKK